MKAEPRADRAGAIGAPARRALATTPRRAYARAMGNVIFTAEQYAAAVERFKKKLAARQAAREAVERIVAGAPRSSFGKFTLSFEEIEADIGWLEPRAPYAIPGLS